MYLYSVLFSAISMGYFIFKVKYELEHNEDFYDIYKDLLNGSHNPKATLKLCMFILIPLFNVLICGMLFILSCSNNLWTAFIDYVIENAKEAD